MHALLDWPARRERLRTVACARASSARRGASASRPSACCRTSSARPGSLCSPCGGAYQRPPAESYRRPPAQRARVRARRYVHRVGRTARLGREGEALLFLLPSERGYLAQLEAAGHALQELPLLPLLDALPGGPVRPCGALGRPPALGGGAEGHVCKAHPGTPGPAAAGRLAGCRGGGTCLGALVQPVSRRTSPCSPALCSGVCWPVAALAGQR